MIEFDRRMRVLVKVGFGLQRHRIFNTLARGREGLQTPKGGQWNGEVAPSPLTVMRDVWDWRALMLELAFQKTVARYRGFLLGPLWVILGFSLFVFGLAALWSALQNLHFSVFLPYVAVGLLAWNVVLGVLADGSRSLTENRNLIHQSKAPLLVYPLVTLLRHVFLSAHNLLIVIPVLMIYSPPTEPQILWIVPGIVCLLVFCLSVCVTLSIVGAYFPDLSEIIASVLRFTFFVTPIFWMPEAKPEMHLVWLLNPFFYSVEAVRGPLLQTSDPGFVIPVLAALTVASSAVAAATFSIWGRNARTRV